MADTRDRAGSGQIFDIESPMAIELRRIMIRLSRQLDFDRKRALMVTSAQRGEGKSLFSLHFSLVLAYHLPKRILLIDADVRRPVQHAVFEVDLGPGFANVLAGELPATKAVHRTRVEESGFPVRRHGRRQCQSPVRRRPVRKLVEDLHGTYDLIVLDSPPVVPVSDPLHYLDAVRRLSLHGDGGTDAAGMCPSAGSRSSGALAPTSWAWWRTISARSCPTTTTRSTMAMMVQEGAQA